MRNVECSSCPLSFRGNTCHSLLAPDLPSIVCPSELISRALDACFEDTGNSKDSFHQLEEVCLHTFSCSIAILLPRFPQHPCRLWTHGVFSVFQQKCQVWFWHLQLPTSSEWMDARDTLRETLLVNGAVPPVRMWASDVLHRIYQRTNAQAALCCSSLAVCLICWMGHQ